MADFRSMAEMLAGTTSAQAWAAAQDARRGARVGAMLAADPVSPDEAAEADRIGAEIGLPGVAVQADLGGFRARADQKRLAERLAQSPATTAWLSDRKNGRLGKDDTESLSALELTARTIAEPLADTGVVRGARRGTARLPAIPAQMEARSAAQQLGDAGKSYEEILDEEYARMGVEDPSRLPASMRVTAMEIARARAERAEGLTEEDREALLQSGAEALKRARDILDRANEIEMSEGAARFRDNAAAEAENSVMGMIQAFADDPVGGGQFVVELASEVLPQLLAATATTALTRSPAAGVTVMAGGSFLQENAQAAMEFLEEEGVDLSTPGAAALVMQNTDLMRKAQERGMTRGLVIAVFDAMSGGVAGQAMMRNPMGDAVAQSVFQAAFGAGGEATAQLAAGQEVNWKDIVLEGAAEIVTGPIEVGGVAGRAFLNDTTRAGRSGQTATQLDALDKVAAESKLKQRSPEAFRDFADNLGLGNIYVPADDLREYFQAKDVPFEDALSELEIDPEVFDALSASGGDVPIPQSVYLSKISGTEDADWFRQNAVRTVNEMSMSEAQRFNAGWQDELRKSFEEAESERLADLEARASDVQVYDSVYSQLRSAGRTADVAQQEAKLWQAFWRTMAERYNDDALDLARSMGVEFRGPGDDQRRLRGKVDAALNTLRDGRFKPRPQGESLMEAVIGSGGIQDEGGDLASMDAPRGLVAETREQIMDRRNQPSLGGMPSTGQGMSLDAMTQRMFEAGYFPGVAREDVTPSMLLEALQEEIAGRPVYRPGDEMSEADAEIQALADALERAAVDLSEVDNDAAIEALEAAQGQKLFQSGESTKRGSIVIPGEGVTSGTTVINLFEGADLSSVIHESGHFFLEAFTALADSPDAPQQMRDDLEAIRKFVGGEPGKTYSTEQQETWARGFEAYAMEGKAPSLELADAFARFKAWLLRIYRTVRGLNVKLTPEVREVMDRMLATDAEIEAAREMQNLRPLFTDADAVGMSPSSWKTYQRFARRSKEEADQKLLEATMAKVRREKARWWKEERKQVMAQVSERLASEPRFRFLQVATGMSDEDMDIRLNRQELVDVFGEGILKELSRQRLGGKRAIYADDGESLGVVAEFFGFPDQMKMVEILQNTGKMRDEIATETDRIMSDRYGDPLNDGTVEQEALDAIHGEQQAQMVASEIRTLADRAGRPTRNTTARIYRQRARQMLGAMSVQEATRPAAFLQAERKAAKRAEDAFARVVKGDDEALGIAMRHKEQQLLNHYLYMEARDAERMVASKRDKMRSYARDSVRSKIGPGYIEQIDAILEQYDFRKRSPGQVARAESLEAFVNRMVEEGREAELNIDTRLMDEARRTHYSRLKMDELRGLFDTIANLDHLGRTKAKLIEAQRRRDLQESIDRVVNGVTSNYKRAKDPSQRSTGRSFLNLMRRPDTILVALDGGDEMGPVYEELKQSVDRGAALEQKMGVEMVEKLDALFADHYKGKALKTLSKPVQIAGPRTARQWTKAEVLAVALNTGNENNYQRLMDDKVDPDSRMTPDTLKALLATLDENDWRFVQGMWDTVNSLWPDLAAVHKRRTGVEPDKVQGKLMVDAPDFVRGGYYPIAYDPARSALADKDEQSAWDKFTSAGHGSTAAVANGMTKQRQNTGGGRTLLFDLSVPFKHMRETTRYIALSEAVDASYRILNSTQVRETFMAYGQKDTHETLMLWLKDVARGPVFNTDVTNSLARLAKNNFTLSKLAFNFKTVALQATGLGQSAATIGKRNMIRGFRAYMRAPNQVISEVREKSPFMSERATTFQKDIYDFINETQVAGPLQSGLRKGKVRLSKAGFWFMIKTQFLVVDMPTWLGAYGQAVDDGKAEADAVAYADRMVARSQDSGLFQDRAGIERGTLSRNTVQSDFVRLFTTLGGYMFTKQNRAQVTLMQARQGLKDSDQNNAAVIANAAVDLSLLFAFEAVAMGMIYAWATDEEDEEDVNEFLLTETGMAVVGGFPFIRDAANTFRGYDAGGTYGGVLETFGRVAIQSSQMENDPAFRRAVTDLIGLATGLPTTATVRGYESLLGDKAPSEAFFGTNPLTR